MESRIDPDLRRTTVLGLCTDSSTAAAGSPWATVFAEGILSAFRTVLRSIEVST